MLYNVDGSNISWAGEEMYNSEIYRMISGEVDKIRIIDTHEHLTHQHGLMWADKIDFGRLFVHYANSDLISAGMPPEAIANVSNPESPWDVPTKWKAIEPYYLKTWNTGYCECLRIAIRDIFGIEDLSADTVEELSARMHDVSRGTWTREIFDKANIDIALEHGAYQSPVYTREKRSDLFLYDMVDDFTNLNLEPLLKDSGLEVPDLDGYLLLIDWYFDKFAKEASAFKTARAYDRSLSFEDVPQDHASGIFDRLLKQGNHLTHPERNALEDFIMHYCIKSAGDHNLPVKFHTGLQEGNSNDIRNSRAGLLVNLFMKYPKTKFDIYHISWPYTEELISICKNFPNVYIDFCWAWIFNPPAARRYLSDMLETVPLNKIHGFGGDFIFVEGTYGHSRIARREISRVLTEKVEEGRFNECYAIKAAIMILRENAIENFHINEKRPG